MTSAQIRFMFLSTFTFFFVINTYLTKFQVKIESTSTWATIFRELNTFKQSIFSFL